MSHPLTLLQLNDLHGYVEPHPEVFRTQRGKRYGTAGGIARIATLFEQVRTERRGAVIALDNGDTFHGTFAAVQSRGGGSRAADERAVARCHDGALGVRLRPRASPSS